MKMKTNFVRPLLCGLGILLSAITARADVKLSAIFSDHMVLQRGVAVPVWGWADANTRVTVKFAGQSKTVAADASGKWLVKLDAMPAAAEGRELVVESGAGSVKLADVVVGDVWLCSGQSNMHFQMKSVANADVEIAAAKNPAVRFFTVPQQFGQQPLEDVAGAWKPVSPETAADCSAVACFFGMALQPKIDVPVGLIVSSVGGTRIESWMRAKTLADTGESRALVEKWAKISPDEFAKIGTIYREFQRQRDVVHPQAVKAAKAEGKPVPPDPIAPKERCHDAPSALHNGMIDPLHSFALRGAVWYQGESNSGHPAPYKKLLPALIADWRRVWGAEMPFLFVQLPPYRSTHPAFREAQQSIWQNTPRTAMVVTTDVGDAKNIHPTRKRPVGERLAVAARALSYGEKIESSGPVFKSIAIEGSRAVVSFTHVGGGLVAKDGALKGFTLAGADGKFVAADAVIDGSTVIVSSDKVSMPVAVRYGWATVPDVNLFNREGLPAAPFRTDAW